MSGRLTVAIETSTRLGSLAAAAGERRAACRLEDGRAHASDLVPSLDRLVRELERRPTDLALVCVGTGPGSYTGLRVGIATAIGLARASGAPAVGVPSGETLAFGALDPGQEAYHLIDGRSNAFYLARYRRLELDVEVLEAPCVVGPDELAARLAAQIPVLTDAASLEAARLPEPIARRARLDAVPRADALLDLGARRAAARGGQPLDAIQPLYLRPFAATPPAR